MEDSKKRRPWKSEEKPFGEANVRKGNKVIRTISVSQNQDQEMEVCRNWHGWTVSRWYEEAAKYQIIIDKKNMAKEEAEKITPESLNWRMMSDEEFKEWVERVSEVQKMRHLLKVAEEAFK